MELKKYCKIHGHLFSHQISKHNDKHRKDGYKLRCNLCQQENHRKWYQLNKEKIKTQKINQQKELIKAVLERDKDNNGSATCGS